MSAQNCSALLVRLSRVASAGAPVLTLVLLSAAFELYSRRLGLSDFKREIERRIKREKVKDFYSLWNRPYNFF